MVTTVRGSDVGPTALTRTETVVAPAGDAHKTAMPAARRIFFNGATPFHEGVWACRSEEVSWLPGLPSRAFPAARCGVPVACALRACGRRPRSQWRVRAGFTPASLTTDPERRQSIS